MRVLFVGGTGTISTACSRLAVERGIELFVLNRGRNPDRAPGATNIVADYRDERATAAVLAGRTFDAVVDWIAFTPEDLERDLRLFAGRTGQYIFISSASAYNKPARDWPVREDTPLANPYWDYSRAKIACEERLMRAFRETSFPFTVVRPSHTYGDNQIPLAVSPWQKPYTLIARMRAGKPIVVPGDGTSLWTLTHNTDFAKAFVGLLGRQAAIGQAFNIMSDEALTWDAIHHQAAAAAGCEARIVHIASDFIAACLPEWEGSLIGDKSVTSIFDTTKVKRFVPDFHPTMPFAEGIKRSIAWFDADPARQEVDEVLDRQLDRMIEAYAAGLEQAKAAVAQA